MLADDVLFAFSQTLVNDVDRLDEEESLVKRKGMVKLNSRHGQQAPDYASNWGPATLESYAIF